MPATSPHSAHLDVIRSHFDAIASDYLNYKAKNPYFHGYLNDWCRSLVPPGRKILDMGPNLAKADFSAKESRRRKKVHIINGLRLLTPAPIRWAIGKFAQ